MDKLKPGALAIVGGGVLLLIAGFLDWSFRVSPYNGSLFGITGVVLFVIAGFCIAVPLIRALAPQVKLPSSIAGLNLNQALAGLGLAVFVLAFSLLFRREVAVLGTILGVVSSLAIIGGAHMENNTSS